MVRCALIVCFVAACGGGDDAANPDGAPDADPCTGTCLCKVDDDCPGNFTVCIDEVTNRTCGCSTGYAMGAGGCAWVGNLVRDPGFQTAGTWTVPTGTTVDPTLNEAGMLDPGAGRIVGTAGLCALSRIRQPIEMPKLARSQPLVVELSHRYRSATGPALPARATFGMGTTWSENITGTGNPWIVSRVCLGAGQYAPAATKGKGAIVEVALMPSVVASPCADPSSLDIDRFDIKPAMANECPTAGTAQNGDAEAAGGWTFSGSSSNGAPFTTMIEPLVGENNSRGVRLFARNRCSNLSATTRVSIPLSAAAFHFYNKTTTALTNVATEPNLGGIDLPTIAANPAAQPQKVCVPAPMRGAVVDFRAEMNLDGVCADLVNATSILDNLTLADEVSCGTDAYVTDPGFESQNILIGAVANPGRSLARTLVDPALARTGNGVLQLSVTQECEGPAWTGNIVVPEPQGSAGPAFKFFYKAPAAAKYRFEVTGAGAFTPVLDNQYREGRICLNPKLAGRAQKLTFRMAGVGTQTCANTIPAETAFVDDLSATVDPACPAN